MSEEILKALMQLFAIITKQDEGVNEKERKFIENFLRQQLSADMVASYITLYEGFLGVGASADAEGEEETKKKKLTSVKDSVKTLSICKKINKTLTQKQKIIVLIRLFELIDIENKGTDEKNQKFEIIDTVSTVFNILPEEFKSIEAFCRSSDFTQLQNIPEILLVAASLTPIENGAKIIQTETDSPIGILRVNSEDMYFLRYLGKSSILLNGQPISKNQVNLFSYGSSIKLPKGDPIYYSDIHAHFLQDMDFSKMSFQATNISYKFANGNIGLRDVQIEEGPGKLIAIMGGSGAGKTTLLNVLAGLEEPSKGEIRINGIDINKEHHKVEGVIGYVAQDDILFEELTVFQNLFYNAKLCFKNKTDDELTQMVHKTLKNLGLFEIRDIKVGNVLNKKISGGQRKRLNIALELIREPAIMFLDEPTSGLSSRDSENVIDLLKELTLKGKIIFVVIHQPSSDIYKMFDKVVILDAGGYQIYYGNPVNAVVYFKQITNQINAEEGQCSHCGNVNPEQIFNTIDAKVVDEYGNLTETRKISPKIWNDFYKQNTRTERIEAVNEAPPKSLQLPGFITQFSVFVKRDVLSKVSNVQYVLINLLEAPLLAFILSFIIRYIDDPSGETYYFGTNENIPAYLFMSVIVALFMGLTVSAEEIIRDAKIRKRENFLNLNKASYFGSKIFIMFCLSAIQTLLYTIIGNSLLGIHDMAFSYWMMLFTLSCTANLMGLNISATFNSAVTIYILIPLLLIPQMILSGAIFSFDKLNRFLSEKDKVPLIADVMASRWGYEGLAVHQFKNNKFEKVFYDYEKNESKEDYKSAYWAPKLITKLDECKANLYSGDPQKDKQFDQDVALIKHELYQELSENKNIMVDEEDFEKAFKQLDARAIDYLKNVVRSIKGYYQLKYVEVNTRKDLLVSKYLASERTAALFNETKKEYFNESLADIVRNATAKNKIIEYQGRLVQLKDPVYLDPKQPDHPFDYRAHLYAPEKNFLGRRWDTFWFNICVIWVFTFGLAIALYFEIFRNLAKITSRFKSKNNENS